MAYITISNAKRIIKQKTEIKSLNIEGDVYRHPIPYFNKYEKNYLLAIKKWFEDPELFFKDYYTPLEIENDTYTWVYEALIPAYHELEDCPRLHADYKNYEIPQEIRQQGNEKIMEFRNWFKENESVFLSKPEIYLLRLGTRWNIKESNQKAHIIPNTGSTKIMNYTKEELEQKIDTLIADANAIINESEKNKTILDQFAKNTFLAYKFEQIRFNYTGYKDEIIKPLLRKFDDEIKKPLQQFLIEYYRITLNPDLEFEGHLLEQLGFRSCSKCGINPFEHDSDFDQPAYDGTTETEPIDDLPF